MTNPIITCKIKYARFGPDKLDRSIWKPFRIKVPMSTTTRDFDRQMQPRIVKRLREDKKLLQKVKSRNRLLLYQTEIWTNHCGLKTFRIGHEEDHTFETLADLYEDPDVRGKQLELDLNVGTSDPRTHYENQPKDTQKIHWRRRLSASELVQSSSGVEEDHWEYTYIRLGIRPPDQTAAPDDYDATTYIPNSNDNVCDDPAVDAWLKTTTVIYLRDMIVGYWIKGYTDFPQSFHMLRVEAWDFGDYCIGNMIENFKRHRIRDVDVYLQPFDGANDAAEMHNLARQQLRFGRRRGEPIAPVPFMPIYTLNLFDPKSHGLGVEDESIDAVVRFVDHLDMPYYGEYKEPHKWLPFNSQWTFEPEDNATVVFKAIQKELRQQAENPDINLQEERVLRGLYARPLKGLWTLQCWVLPQPRPGEEGERKMYRFPVDAATPARSLGEFLSQEWVDKGGYAARALYMEAHIVRKEEVQLEDFQAAMKQVKEREEEFWRAQEQEAEGEGDEDEGES